MSTPIEAGAEISKDWWPPAVKAQSSTDILNLTNTTYQPGSPEVGHTFTAPLSGRVGVCINCHGVQQASGDRLFFSYRIYLGTSTAGTLFQDAAAGMGMSSSGSTSATGEFGHGMMSMVDGLTPGSVYYAVVVHQIEGAGTTSDVAYRRIIVFPVP